MLPANQRFDAGDDALAHIHLRLVIKTEFARSQPFLDSLQVFTMMAGAAIIVSIKPAITVATRLLGGIHRLIGMAQQGVWIRVVIGIEGNAETAAQRLRLVRDRKRQMQR